MPGGHAPVRSRLVTRRWLAVAAAVLTAAACSGSDEGIARNGSEVATGGTVDLGIPPSTYVVTYRVDERDGDSVHTTTARLAVDRPFASRFTTSDGPPPGTDILTDRVSGFGVFAQRSGTGAPVALTAAPALAAGDVRADVLVPALLGAGAAERREQREVAGRRCQVYRLGGPITAGEVVPSKRGSLTYAEVCIDADGLVLEEITVEDGEPVARWLAVKVEAAVDPELVVEGAEPVPVQQGGGSLRPVEPGSRSLGEFWELDGPPEGFERMGRYAVVPPRPGDPADPNTRRQLVAAVTDVWRGGDDVVIVDQGGTVGQVLPFLPHPHGRLVDLGALGEGEWFFVPTGAEVRVVRPPGRFVRVTGTLPPEDLIELARSLNAVDGAGLVYLDEPAP